MRRLGPITVAVLATAVIAGCDAGPHEPRVIEVPGDAASIQQAVDEARPGDVVLIAPGTYAEEVRVTTDDITIRGADRNDVLLDGEDRLRNGITVTSDGVRVENLTVARYRVNGVLVTGTGDAGVHDPYADPANYSTEADSLHFAERFQVSYVTAYNNGLYGVYAFQARGGLIDHVYASGHPDSGIYVGQCTECSIVVDRAVLENNAIGYYGTNASGDVYLVNSTMRGNRLGATPNSQDQELLAPQTGAFLVGNIIVDNDNPDTPPIERGFFGGGIGVGGGHANYIARNYIAGHDVFGIGVIQLNPYDPEGNTIEGNVVQDNRVDLLYAPSLTATTSLGNCFAGNTFATSVPADLELLMPCDGAVHEVLSLDVRFPTAPAGIDYRTMPAPPAQEGMPGDLRSLPSPLPATPELPDLAAITVPRP